MGTPNVEIIMEYIVYEIVYWIPTYLCSFPRHDPPSIRFSVSYPFPATQVAAKTVVL